MIKMIVSDIDGTLLPEGTDQINPEFFDLIRDLKKQGILFVAASGRQYHSMRYLFAPVADDMIFIAENGSLVMQKDQPLATLLIPQETAEELVHYLRTFPDGEIVLSTPEMIYLDREDGVREQLENGYHNKLQVVEDVLPFCKRSNKITIHRTYEIDELGTKIRDRFGDRLQVAVAGSVWVDLMDRKADKGNSVVQLQQMLGITKEETMAFGDNCNDIGMLQQADWSFAVENAHPELKKAAKYEVPSYEKNGVLNYLRQTRGRFFCPE